MRTIVGIHNKIISTLKANGCIEAEEEELYSYGLGILIDNSLLLITMLTIGVIVGALDQTLIFIAVFVGMRKYAGGYHANRRWKCFLLTNSLYIAALVITRISILYNVTFIGIICSLYTISIIWIAAPIIGINNMKGDEGIRKDRDISRFLTIVGVIIAWLGFYYYEEWKALFFTIIVTMTEVAVLIKICYLKGEKENEKSNINVS